MQCSTLVLVALVYFIGRTLATSKGKIKPSVIVECCRSQQVVSSQRYVVAIGSIHIVMNFHSAFSKRTIIGGLGASVWGLYKFALIGYFEEMFDNAVRVGL